MFTYDMIDDLGLNADLVHAGRNHSFDRPHSMDV